MPPLMLVLVVEAVMLLLVVLVSRVRLFFSFFLFCFSGGWGGVGVSLGILCSVGRCPRVLNDRTAHFYFHTAPVDAESIYSPDGSPWKPTLACESIMASCRQRQYAFENRVRCTKSGKSTLYLETINEESLYSSKRIASITVPRQDEPQPDCGKRHHQQAQERHYKPTLEKQQPTLEKKSK